MKKYLLFGLGIVLVSMGIALNIKSTLGSSPIDTLVFNLASVAKMSSSLSLIIVNGTLILFYFILSPNRKVIFLIIATLLLSLFLSFFQKYVFLFTTNNIIYQILIFILAINLISFGVALEIKSNVATTALEAIVLFFKNKLSKLSFGLIRTIVELIIIIISATISLIFDHNLGEVGIATVIMLLTCGFLTDFYLYLLKVKKNAETID